MKLRVSADGASGRGRTFYAVHVDTGRRKRSTSAERERLWALVPRIDAMAKRVLGRSTSGVDTNLSGDTMLFLSVKTGTSRNPRTKFKLRSLLGWIELCDDEPEKR